MLYHTGMQFQFPVSVIVTWKKKTEQSLGLLDTLLFFFLLNYRVTCLTTWQPFLKLSCMSLLLYFPHSKHVVTVLTKWRIALRNSGIPLSFLRHSEISICDSSLRQNGNDVLPCFLSMGSMCSPMSALQCTPTCLKVCLTWSQTLGSMFMCCLDPIDMLCSC